jgi:hypothetical protein
LSFHQSIGTKTRTNAATSRTNSLKRHRALMTMGTLSVAQAGIGRIGVIRAAIFTASHAAFFPTFWGSTIAVGLLLWLLKLAMTRRIDRYFSAALGLFIASGLLSSYVSTTGWWLHAAHWMTR